MSPQLVTALLAWRRAQRKRWLKKGRTIRAWVFPSLEGTALEERNVRHVFTRLLEKADLRQIRINDLRHTYATLLLQAGAPITYDQSAARTPGRLDHALRVRALGTGRIAARSGSARHAATVRGKVLGAHVSGKSWPVRVMSQVFKAKTPPRTSLCWRATSWRAVKKAASSPCRAYPSLTI